MDLDIITNLSKRFLARKKNEITPNGILKNIGEIKVWAWCTGMGSDANIFFVKEDGSLFNYDHYKHWGYGKQVDEFRLLRDVLCEQGIDWEVIPCMFSNNLYIRPVDKAWFESLCKDLHLMFVGNPYAYMECICQKLEEQNKNI